MKNHLLTKAILAIDQAYRTPPTDESYKRYIEIGCTCLNRLVDDLMKDPVGNCDVLQQAQNAVFLIGYQLNKVNV